jgi:hypothetical protein
LVAAGRGALSVFPALRYCLNGPYRFLSHSNYFVVIGEIARKNVAVCLLPGTELSFAEEVRREKVFGRGVTSLSGIEPQSFGKSTRTGLQPITTRLNSRMVRLFF